MTRPTRRLAPLLAAGLAALTLAACGGGDSSSSTAAGDGEEAKRLAFEDCLRDQGIEVRSTEGGGFAVRSRAMDEGGASAPGPDTAMEDCRRRTGWAPRPPSEEQQQEMRDKALEFARCMREHGVDMPDPAGDGRVVMRAGPGESASVERAQRACGDLMGGATVGVAPEPVQ